MFVVLVITLVGLALPDKKQIDSLIKLRRSYSSISGSNADPVSGDFEVKIHNLLQEQRAKIDAICGNVFPNSVEDYSEQGSTVSTTFQAQSSTGTSSGKPRKQQQKLPREKTVTGSSINYETPVIKLVDEIASRNLWVIPKRKTKADLQKQYSAAFVSSGGGYSNVFGGLEPIRPQDFPSRKRKRSEDDHLDSTSISASHEDNEDKGNTVSEKVQKIFEFGRRLSEQKVSPLRANYAPKAEIEAKSIKRRVLPQAPEEVDVTCRKTVRPSKPGFSGEKRSKEYSEKRAEIIVTGNEEANTDGARRLQVDKGDVGNRAIGPLSADYSEMFPENSDTSQTKGAHEEVVNSAGAELDRSVITNVDKQTVIEAVQFMAVMWPEVFKDRWLDPKFYPYRQLFSLMVSRCENKERIESSLKRCQVEILDSIQNKEQILLNFLVQARQILTPFKAECGSKDEKSVAVPMSEEFIEALLLASVAFQHMDCSVKQSQLAVILKDVFEIFANWRNKGVSVTLADIPSVIIACRLMVDDPPEGKQCFKRYYMYRTSFGTMADVATVERGRPFTFDYKVFFRSPKSYISPWHDIPLYSDQKNKIFNMVVEVPRWTNAKMEIATKEKLNPIKQDVKKEKVRFVDNCFPHHGYIWNYGALPQTWEDPEHKDPDTQASGDNDPIDVCEIGSRIAQRGEVMQVKILGTLALIDEGETDWKLIAIDVRDALADQLNDIEDVETNLPGLLRATHEWFRIYKIPTGKPENKFAFGGQYKNKEYAEKVIEETHNFWKKLISNPSPPGGLCGSSFCVSDAAHHMSTEDAENIVASAPELGPPEPVPSSVDKWHFIKE